jgi:outer membrane protein W
MVKTVFGSGRVRFLKCSMLMIGGALTSSMTFSQGLHGGQAASSGTGLSAGTVGPGVFSGIAIPLSDRLSIESFARSNSSLSSGALGAPPKVQAYSTVGQTVMGQYRFGDEKSSFRPRLGAGLAYNLNTADRSVGLASALHGDPFATEKSFNARTVNGLGMALEVGASYALSNSWYLEGSVMKSFVRSSGSALNGATGLGAAPGLKIDPLMFSFSLGFKFQ